MSQYEAVRKAEQTLLDAMFKGDVVTLERMISDDLLFTNHLGAIVSKEMDLAALRTGALHVHTLDVSEQQIKGYGDTAIVSVKLKLGGTYEGTEISDVLRYTRVWRLQEGTWQVVAAHCTPVQ